MRLLRRPASQELSTALAVRADPTLPAILEFQSPSTAIISTPVPASARRISWSIFVMVVACFAAAYFIKVEQVVTSPGRVVAKGATIVVQPLDTSIIRSIEVHEGDQVRAGQVLARLDPTFAAADLGAMAAQVSTYQAQVSRLQAELEHRPFSYAGLDPNMSLQSAIYAQRMSEYSLKVENYRQKLDSLRAALSRAESDIASYRDRVGFARTLESMRKELERLNVGSKLNTLSASDGRVEAQRTEATAQQIAIGARRDIAALEAERDGFTQSWHADVAEKLSDATAKLSDARESLNKAQLRARLVELRADRDATVLSIGRVSIGSVVTTGQQLFTLIANDAPLEIEVNIAGAENGYVHVGDPAAIKFDTFPYALYGLAHGQVRLVSADSFIAQDDQRNPTGALPIPQAGGLGGSAGVWYRGRVSIDNLALHDVPANFKPIPGMSVTVDILVGHRTILAYMFGRFIPLTREGMREP